MAVIFASCEKEDLEKKNFYISQNSFNTDYFVRDGYLVFKNKTSFIKVKVFKLFGRGLFVSHNSSITDCSGCALNNDCVL